MSWNDAASVETTGPLTGGSHGDTSDDPLVVRLKCEFLCYDEVSPHDTNCDSSKTGTGFLLQTESGRRYLVTAHHVVSNSKRLTATTQSMKNGEPMLCRVIGQNPYIDVAILECDEETLASRAAFRPSRSATLEPGLTTDVITTIHAAICIAQHLVRQFYLVGILQKSRRPQRSKTLKRELVNVLIQLRLFGRLDIGTSAA